MVYSFEFSSIHTENPFHRMFEARLTSSSVLKKVLDAIKDLLNEATFDCTDSGIQVIRESFAIREASRTEIS